jgi:hypothetical protein
LHRTSPASDTSTIRRSQISGDRRDASILPEILEPVRRQRRVDSRAGDRPMPEPPLDRPGVVALVGEGVAQAWRSMCGWALSSRPAPAAARSIMRASPAVVNGDPRSLTTTTGHDGLLRWSLRRSGNRKLRVAQRSFGFPRMLNKRSSLVRHHKLLPPSSAGERSWRACARILEPIE